MARGNVVVARVVRVPRDGTGDPPTTAAGLRALTAPTVLDAAAKVLEADEVDVVAYASTTTGYAAGFDAEDAMVSRLSTLLGMPVVATCTAAVEALLLLGVERV